jgi:hypothetical protein
MSLLQNQFDEYQTTHISEIPTYTSESDIELFWGEMAKLFDIFVQKKRFNVLCKNIISAAKQAVPTAVSVSAM